MGCSLEVHVVDEEIGACDGCGRDLETGDVFVAGIRSCCGCEPEECPATLCAPCILWAAARVRELTQ